MSPPTKYAVALFPGFEALDVFGSLDILNLLSKTVPLEFATLAATLDAVSTKAPITGQSIGQSVMPTHTFETCPDDIEVLLVPGGFGERDPNGIRPVVEFVKSRYPKLRFLLTVCTGSALVAQAGVLNGREATSNKRAWDMLSSIGTDVQWVRRARWVVDGNIWTSSGVTAGMDMMYAFVAEQYGEHVAKELADIAEYVRNTDPSNDPFA
ncbi:class I glutamine amidotransferase-like protein [Xylariaceae sp. FL0662B]|nr:class I glutamine amidotransferase-like protein [Xylariaceae sp. FL0662B]